MSTAHRQLQSQYGVFLNAFSYTLATSVINNGVETTGHSMLVIAAALCVGLTTLAIASAELAAVADATKGSILGGPAALLAFLLATTSSVLINFLSISLGQWAVALSSEIADALPAAVVGTSLLWLAGVSANLV